MQKIKIEYGLLSGKSFFREELKTGNSCFTNPETGDQFYTDGTIHKIHDDELRVSEGLLSGQIFQRKDLEIDDYHLDCIGETAAFTKGFSFGFKS